MPGDERIVSGYSSGGIRRQIVFYPTGHYNLIDIYCLVLYDKYWLIMIIDIITVESEFW